MFYKVIATPCKVGEGDYKGWRFSRDDGRILNLGEIRFTYNPICRDRIEAILKQALRDYKNSEDEYWRQYRRSKQSLEYTRAMRVLKQSNDKIIKEARDLIFMSL